VTSVSPGRVRHAFYRSDTPKNPRLLILELLKAKKSTALVGKLKKKTMLCAFWMPKTVSAKVKNQLGIYITSIIGFAFYTINYSIK